jgi:hypothetical protein
VVGFERKLKHKRKKTDEQSGLVSYLSDLCRMVPGFA